MGWIRKRNDKSTYEASYRDPAGRIRSKSFKSKAEARSFLATAESSKQRGDWTDPRGAKVRLEEFADAYLDSAAHLRPGTRVKVEGHLRNHIYPFFDRTPLGAIKPAYVRSWIAALEKEGLAPGTINGIYRTFFKVLKTAVIDGLISRSPCVGIDLPKQTTHEEMNFLTPEQVEALAQSIQPRYRALIFTAAYTGMRWGELAALKVERLNLLRGTVDVGAKGSHLFGYARLKALAGPVICGDQPVQAEPPGQQDDDRHNYERPPHGASICPSTICGVQEAGVCVERSNTPSKIRRRPDHSRE